MATARTLVVIPRRRRKAAKIRIQRRLTTALWRYLSELAALLIAVRRLRICRRNSFAFRRFTRRQ